MFYVEQLCIVVLLEDRKQLFINNIQQQIPRGFGASRLGHGSFDCAQDKFRRDLPSLSE